MQRPFSILLTVVLAITSAERLWANGTFKFIQNSLLASTTIEKPVLAILRLSGPSPYDHTSVASLKFTALAEDVLGYVGPYEGGFDFDISNNRVIENSENILGATSIDISNIGALIFDSDPPDFNAGSLDAQANSSLALSFFNENEEEPFSYISNGTGNLSALGQWVRIVPEPNSIAVLCATAMFYIANRKYLFLPRIR